MQLKLKQRFLLKFLAMTDSVDDIDVDEKLHLILTTNKRLDDVHLSATHSNCKNVAVNTLAEAWLKPVSTIKSTKKVESSVNLANYILLTVHKDHFLPD